MRHFGDRFKGRAGIAFVTVLTALMVLDALVIYYTIGYTTDEKSIEAIPTPAETLDLWRSSQGDIVLLTDEGAFLMGQSSFQLLNVSGTATDLAVGSETGVVAVGNDDGRLYYFKQGEVEASFSVQLDGEIDILGIVERISARTYNADQIVLLVRNDTGSRVVVASIAGAGAIDWSFDFDNEITSYAVSDMTRSFALSIENNSVYYFKRTESSPRSIFELSQSVKEVWLSPSGLNLAVLYGDNPLYVADFDINEPEPLWVTEVPADSKGLQMHKEGDWIVVRSGDNLIKADGSGSRFALSRPGMERYVIPTVAEKVFVASEGELSESKWGREAPVWVAEFGESETRILTDAAGSFLIAWNASSLAIIDDSQATLGSGTMWLAIGFLLIGEAVGIPLFFWRAQIARLRKTAFYVIIIGAFAGVALGSLLLDPDPASFFGGVMAYLLIGGTISALSALIAWNSEGGLGSIVIGFATGLLVSIPVALVAVFLLWASGHDFGAADIFFGSALNGLVLGMKMGVVGGIVGYLCNYFVK